MMTKLCRMVVMWDGGKGIYTFILRYFIRRRIILLYSGAKARERGGGLYVFDYIRRMWYVLLLDIYTREAA